MPIFSTNLNESNLYLYKNHYRADMVFYQAIQAIKDKLEGSFFTTAISPERLRCELETLYLLVGKKEIALRTYHAGLKDLAAYLFAHRYQMDYWQVVAEARQGFTKTSLRNSLNERQQATIEEKNQAKHHEKIKPQGEIPAQACSVSETAYAYLKQSINTAITSTTKAINYVTHNPGKAIVGALVAQTTAAAALKTNTLSKNSADAESTQVDHLFKWPQSTSNPVPHLSLQSSSWPSLTPTHIPDAKLKNPSVNKRTIDEDFPNASSQEQTKRQVKRKSGLVTVYSAAYAEGVTINSNYVYLAEWTVGLKIISVSNPANPVQIGYYNTPGLAHNVAVSGNYAYVADDTAGLQIINTSDPANPRLVGNYNTPGSAQDVVINGNYAYVADDISGVQIINISNPASPILIGSYNTPGNAIGLALSGNYTYVADGSTGLQIINISNPANPTLASSFGTSDSASGIAVRGNYAYVSDNHYGLEIINITDVANPTLAGKYDIQGGSASKVAVSGNYAYVTNNAGGLQIIDISNPANPTLASSLDIFGYTDGISLSGNYAYVGNFNGLLIVKIGLPPILGNNQLTVSEGQTVTLTSSQLDATDPDDPAGDLSFSISNVTGGRFALSSDSNTAITNFTQQQIMDGIVQFIHDGNEAAPSYKVSVSDGLMFTQPVSATITYTSVNDAPINSLPTSVATNKNTAKVFSNASYNAISVSDSDVGSNSLEVTLNITNGVLTLNGNNGLSFSTGDGDADTSMIFTGNITNINKALDGLTFTPALDFYGKADFQIYTSDQGFSGIGGVLTDTDTIAITVNVIPTLTGDTTPLIFTENDVAMIINASLNVTDVDNINLANAKVAIKFYVNGEDVLGFIDQNGITGTFDTINDVLRLNGTATIANYQTALRSITYQNTSDNPSTITRIISITVNDGITDSAAVVRNLTIIPVNDPPRLINPITKQTVVEDKPFNIAIPDNTFSDPDQDDLLLTVTMQTGEPLPNNINFDRETNHLTGKFNHTGANFFSVIATDPSNTTAQVDFEIETILPSSWTDVFTGTAFIIGAASVGGAVLILSSIGYGLWKYRKNHSNILNGKNNEDFELSELDVRDDNNSNIHSEGKSNLNPKSDNSIISPSVVAFSSTSTGLPKTRNMEDLAQENATDNLQVSFTIPYAQLTFSSKLGVGGFGVVYQGTWRYNPVAIKQLHSYQLSSGMDDEFKREMRIMSQLRSPNIVQLYGIVTDHNPYCLVMEYMPKGSLFTVLHSAEPLTWAIKESIGFDIAKGLAYLHQEKILHCDLKSMNVLLDKHYNAKLTDFGLARMKTEVASTSTNSNKAVGTLAWMAPELFKRKVLYTEKADMYSYGMVLWEIASREVPFKDAHSANLIPQWVAEGEREEIPQDTPPKLAKLIRFCWEAAPEKRPSAAEAVEQLQANSGQSSVFNEGPVYQDNLSSTVLSGPAYFK